MLHKLYVIFFFSIIPFSSIAQSKNDIIDFNSFEEETLNTLIFNYINHTRDSLNVSPLTIDHKLNQAAKLQTDYCIKINKSTHYHKKDTNYID